MQELISEYLRPNNFVDIALPNELKDKLRKMYESKVVMNMLFYGKPGSGKTTVAKIFVDSDMYDTIQLNGSLETSVEDIRNKVQHFATSCSMFDAHKICFIDEADYLSKNAQAGLRNLIEATSKNCRFIFTANDITKIHPALCSRLLPINFDLTTSQTTEALNMYINRTIEKVKSQKENIDEKRIKRIIELHYPDFRTIANHIEFELI
jgi:replication-associated recombination protein RarA